MAASPPLPDEPLVHLLRAALTTVLGQPLLEAGQGDTVETAEALWRAASARGLRAQVLSRLQLPPSVPVSGPGGGVTVGGRSAHDTCVLLRARCCLAALVCCQVSGWSRAVGEAWYCATGAGSARSRTLHAACFCSAHSTRSLPCHGSARRAGAGVA